jgi:hypothetical protein
MPFQATVFNAMIASPSDVQVERSIVREVMHEWNAIHSKTTRVVLHPVAWETHSYPSMEGRPQSILNRQILDDADLLIGVFWTRLGTPTGEAISGTVEEINRHVTAGKPAMVYFSSAPVSLVDDEQIEQYRAVKQFEKALQTSGLIFTFDSPTKFRELFARNLSAAMADSPLFQATQESAFGGVTPVSERLVPELTEEAKTLLLEAAEDQNGTVMHMKMMQGDILQVNKKQLIEQNNPRSRATWLGALNELLNLGLIEDVSFKGQVFRITREGYTMAELLRS